MLSPDRYNDLLLVEAANGLDPQDKADLDLLRKAGKVPDLAPWAPDHPHVQAAEDKYGIPRGALGALLMVESAGDPEAKSPTGVTGIFQVTKQTGKQYGLTATNRTNPYINTNVAAAHFADLLAASGGDVYGALTKYKGPEISDSAYITRFKRFWGQQHPSSTSAATTTPTTGFAYGVARRAGLRSQDILTQPEEYGVQARRQVLGPTLSGIDEAQEAGQRFVTSTLGLPFALAGQVAQQATGSKRIGDIAQYGPMLLPFAKAGGRFLIRRPLARRELSRLTDAIARRTEAITQAKAQIPQLEAEAVANAPTTLQTSPKKVGQAVASALDEARARAASQASTAIQAARDATPASLPKPTAGTPPKQEVIGMDARGMPKTRVIPGTGTPPRSVTLRDVGDDLINERRIARTLADAAIDFQGWVAKAEAAAKPEQALAALIRGAQIRGPGKAGITLPATEAAQMELRVHRLVTRATEALSPATSIRMLEKAAALRKVQVPELVKARALLTDIESMGRMNVEAQARAAQLRDFLRSPTFVGRMVQFLLPYSIYKAGQAIAHAVRSP